MDSSDIRERNKSKPPESVASTDFEMDDETFLQEDKNIINLEMDRISEFGEKSPEKPIQKKEKIRYKIQKTNDSGLKKLPKIRLKRVHSSKKKVAPGLDLEPESPKKPRRSKRNKSKDNKKAENAGKKGYVKKQLTLEEFILKHIKIQKAGEKITVRRRRQYRIGPSKFKQKRVSKLYNSKTMNIK